jgi:ferredoxin
MNLSRRELFNRLFQVPQRAVQQTRAREFRASLQASANVPRFAIVQGRFCLAYQNSFCSTCVERCPIEGAITMENNLPRVNASLCDGCGQCQQVCPAPRNGILLLPRQRVPALS